MKLSDFFASLFEKLRQQSPPHRVERHARSHPAPSPREVDPPVPVNDASQPRRTSAKWLSPDEAKDELVRNPSGELNFTVELRDGDLRFVSRTSGKMPSKGSPPLARIDIFYFGVRGHQYYAPVRRKVGTQVTLKREPDNPHGATAIAVVNPSTGKTYGYINKGNSRRLYRRIDAGEDFVAIVMGASGRHLAVMPRAIAAELALL